LELHGGTLFAAEHDEGSAFYAYGAGATFDSFKGVFDLEDVTIGTAYWG
jgi:hypothetical protein